MGGHMNQKKQLTKLQRKQEECQLFSKKDKKIIKQLSQCNSSYYKAKVMDMLVYELEDWSYDILKDMVKDQDRLVAEMAVRSLANFIKAEDFASLLEEFEECTDFIKYDIVDMIGYIGFKRKLSDDVIEKRMHEILSKLKKDSRAIYSTYAELYYVTQEEKYIYEILKDLKSKDDDIRHHVLYTIDRMIIENNLNDKKILDDHKQLLQKMEQKLHLNMKHEERYNRIFRERLIRSIRKTLGKPTEIIYSKERNFYEQIPEDSEHILQRCIFELYYPIHDDRQEIVLNLLRDNKEKIKDECFYIFGSYIESLYGNDEVNVYQEWLEENGSRENEAIILYLRAVWEVAFSDYEVSNKRALRYAKKALKCTKNIPAIYHLIGRLTSPDTDYYIELKEKVKQHTKYVTLHEIDDIPLEQLYSYETFLQMDVLKRIVKPENFSCICIEEDYEKFWNWGLEKSVFGE